MQPVGKIAAAISPVRRSPSATPREVNLRLLRTTISILAVSCALLAGPRPAEAKGPKPDRNVRDLRKQAQRLGRDAEATVRTASTGLLRSTRVLTKQVTRGTLDGEAAFDQCFEDCHDYFETCRDAVEGMQIDLSVAFEEAVAAAPQDRALAREILPLPGTAADEITEVVDFILGDVRDTANRAWAQLGPALACDETLATWTLLPWRWPDSPLTAHLRRTGVLPVDLDAGPDVQAVGATCRGKLRLSVPVLHEDDSYQLVVVNAETLEDAGGYIVLPNGIVEMVSDLPEGIYTFTAGISGLTLDSGLAVVPGWNEPPTDEVCRPEDGASARVNGIEDILFPALDVATVTVDQDNVLRHLEFRFQDTSDSTLGRAAFVFSPAPGTDIDLSGAAGTQVTFSAGDAFVSLRLPGSTTNRTTFDGVFEATNLGSLLGENPGACIGLRWAGPVNDLPDPGVNEWLLFMDVGRSGVFVELDQ